MKRIGLLPFARNPEKVYRQWTETSLRVPKGWGNSRQDKVNGRIVYPRIVLVDREVGEALVPEGNGRVITEGDEAFGIPTATEDIAFPHTQPTSDSAQKQTKTLFQGNVTLPSVAGPVGFTMGARGAGISARATGAPVRFRMVAFAQFGVSFWGLK